MNEPAQEPKIDDQMMDQVLAEFGSAWIESSADSEDRFLVDFQSQIGISATARRAEVTPLRRLAYRGLIGLAAAACLAAVFFVPRMRNKDVGSLVYSAGVITQSHPSSVREGHLTPGSILETGPGGEALVAMDNNRVNLIVGNESRLAVAKLDTVDLTDGEIWVRVRPNSGFFEIRTPTGSVHVHGTTFGVRVTPEGTQVEVASGLVELGVDDLCVKIPPSHRGTLHVGATDPIVEQSPVEPTPQWAVDIFKRASESRYSDFFPSVAPNGQQ